MTNDTAVASWPSACDCRYRKRYPDAIRTRTRARPRGRAEFGRKDVRAASPRAEYSGKTFKRNVGTAVRHAAQLPRAGAHPSRINHSADETFAHRRFA
ncbi:hypothetical protein [Burkholderia ubonensis]|uniref:hypothetical protein n=1 Tax=Burkholderia ubonensis TaxID=101571 RepID=UPI000F55C02D|nr:hypothetical protein [Burkholderia ubonensis]